MTAVGAEVVALTEGLLLRALVNNGPMALALEIFLRLDGPAQLRQSFESRGVLGQELVPCLLGPLQAGYVGFQSLVVRSQRDARMARRPPATPRALGRSARRFPAPPAGLCACPTGRAIYLAPPPMLVGSRERRC